jgi:hypothetical protein
MNTGAVLGQGMLILDVTQAAAKPGPVNPTTAGWFKRSEITESQVADFRRTCKPQIAACSPVRWLQSMNHDLSRLSAPARRILQLLKYLVYAGIVPQRLRNSWVKSSRRNSGHDSLALLFAAEIKTSDGSDVPAWTASPLRPGRGTVSPTWTKCFCRRPFRALKTLPILPSAFGRIIRKRFLVWSNEHLKLLINLSHRSP